MKRTWMFLAICLLAAGGCQRSSGAEPNGSLFVSGRIDGDTVDVSFQRSGQIVEINVREGDTVTAGQLLAVISSAQDVARRDAQKARIISDQRRVDQMQHQLATYAERVRQAQIYEDQAQADAPSQVKQAEANLAVSQADLVKWEAEIRQTQADAARYAPLVKSGALAVQIEEQNDTRMKIALASADVSRKQVAVAEADIVRAKAQLQNIPLKEADRKTLERQVDELNSSIASAEADIAADQAELRRIEADLADLKVTAPIGGTILTRV